MCREVEEYANTQAVRTYMKMALKHHETPDEIRSSLTTEFHLSAEEAQRVLDEYLLQPA